MNENFINIVRKHNISQYQIANDTGIPFSTLNGFMLQTHDINRCAAQTILKLAQYFNVAPETLLNTFPIMENVKGVYRSVRYQWKVDKDGLMNIHLINTHPKHIIATGCRCEILNDTKLYNQIAEMLIDYYLEQKELEQEMQEKINEC